jgi:hypothetical protein
MSAAAVVSLKHSDHPYRELKDFVAKKTRDLQRGCKSWSTSDALECIITDIRHLCDRSRLDFDEISEAAKNNFMAEYFEAMSRQKSTPTRKAKSA